MVRNKMTRNRRESRRGLSALAQGSLALARSHANEGMLETIENQLEKELEREETATKSAKPLARVRHKGEKFLHSKHILLIIVALNVVDCILVLGELILDVHFIVDLLDMSYRHSTHFIHAMEEQYPDVPTVHNIEGLYVELLLANIKWNHTRSIGGVHVNRHHKRDLFNSLSRGHIEDHSPESKLHTRLQDISKHSHGNKTPVYTSRSLSVNAHGEEVRAGVGTHDNGRGNDTHTQDESEGHHEHTHSIQEEIAHGLHKASITILAILVAETGIKVFCEGKRIFERKVEVFDGAIVLVSFIVDLVFIKGLTTFPIQKYVFILAFMVPWRVIRVVNSLIVAVMDHEHFRLKLLYHQKKKISATLKTTKQELKTAQMSLGNLQTLCAEAGIPEWKVQHCKGDSSNVGSTKPMSTLALFSKATLKRRNSDAKTDTNGKLHRCESGPALPRLSEKLENPALENGSCKASILRNYSSVVFFNIEESNESTVLTKDSDESTELTKDSDESTELTKDSDTEKGDDSKS